MSDWLDEVVGATGVLVLVASLFSVPIILGGQAVRWLQSGVWPELSIWNSWRWAFDQNLLINTSWEGVNTLVNWALQAPLAFTVPVILAIVGLVFMAMAD